jgi:hypothetical protein
MTHRLGDKRALTPFLRLHFPVDGWEQSYRNCQEWIAHAAGDPGLQTRKNRTVIDEGFQG